MLVLNLEYTCTLVCDRLFRLCFIAWKTLVVCIHSKDAVAHQSQITRHAVLDSPFFGISSSRDIRRESERVPNETPRIEDVATFVCELIPLILVRKNDLPRACIMHSCREGKETHTCRQRVQPKGMVVISQYRLH